MRNYFSKLGTQVPWRTSQSRGATLALPLRYLSALFLLLTFSIGNVWADLTAHAPGVYEKTVAEGGYGCTLTTVATGENAGVFEVYYFSANSKYGNTTDVYGGGSKQQYRIMCADNNSEYQLINTNGTGAFTKSCDWIEMAYTTTGFSKSDYTYSSAFNEFFAIAPNGGNTSNTKTCYIKPKNGDILTLKVSGYVEFAILGADNGSSKYMTITVDGGTPTSWKSNTLSRRSVELTTGEHTIVVANVGTSANSFYGFSLKVPSCSTEITTQPSGATLAVDDANPELSIVATNAASYAWKESSDGTSYDGVSSLGSSASFTPSVNDAVQTKYYYCEVTSSCDGTTVVKSNIVTVNVVGTISYYTVTLNPAGGTIVDATGWTSKDGNYEKEVAEGTELTLPIFTKTGRTFKTWRKAGPADVASPVTVDGDLSLTAIWTATIEQVIYSWEGAEGGAIETGGTASSSTDGGSTFNDAQINVKQAETELYCLQINGNNSFGTNLVQITLAGEEKVKTGDKIKYWGFYSKSSNANARPKMRDANGSKASIFDDPNNLPNLYNGGEPAERTFTVPASINTNAVQITRSQTGSNTWISKLQIIREVQVEEGDLLTVTFDANGGSAIAPVVVASGQAVAKPADPTYAHHRFHEWQLGGVAYDFDDPVTADITLVADWTQLYTISFANGGGSGDAPAAIADKAKDETFEVPANTFTAPEGKEFDKWNDGSADYAPGATYTVGTANVVLTAQWKAVTAKYTVIFKDGETTLNTKLFEVGSNPSDADIDKTKPLFAFAAWQKDAADIALDDEFWATVVKDASVTLTARWTKVYAQDADLEGLVESEGTGADWQAYMTGKGYAYSTSGVSLDAKAGGKGYNNWPYQGLKAKEIGAYVEGRIAADKLVIIKLGHMAAAANVSLDGVAAGTATGLDADEPAGQLNYFYVENESVLRYETTNGGACVLKAITITNPFQVTFNANGGDPVASQYGHPAVTLPDASNGTKSLLGWFDAAEGGNKIGDVGESYTPAADIELFAQWEDVSTDARLASIEFSAVGTLSPAFDPEVTSYTYTMPYGTADVPTISGATSVNANAKAPVIDAQAANWNDVAHIHGVAESDDTKDYYITMKIEPKDGVSIIKVATTGGTNKTVTGLYAGDGDVSLSSSTKMDNGKYIGFTLDGTTLQAGDRINVHTTTAANTGGSHIIFYDNMTDKTELYETGEIGGLGDNIFEINAAMIGSATAYVYRSNADAAHQWNGYVDYIEVLRAMNPVLTAITIDGRDGEIDALDDKHFSVTIPYESDLAALTVVPTIVRNAAHPTTPEAVISNEGAWILGDNTYRIMDKDGDYTDYTITLDRDVLKHTVSFNTHGGTAIDPVLVAHGEYLAAAPSDPEKEDYIFQHWSLSDGGAAVDVTTVQINEDKEFHAVWVADGAIKLLDGSTVNHTNFITAVTADETVEFQGNTVNYAKFSGTVSGVNGVKDLTRVIAYNATTNKTKIRISAHNNSTSARTILVKGLVEGASAAEDLASIALGNKEDVISDWIEFDNAANRTIYIMVSSSAGDVYFTQVKVIESGETPMKQFGEIGYSLNFNKGRAFGKADDDVVFEGLNIELIGDYTALNSGYLKMNSSSMSFTLTNPATLHVTASNNKTYYVSNSASGTDNETAKTGVSEFSLSAGTWYINAGENDVQFTEIEFAEPKCAEPVIDVQPLSKVDYLSGTMSTSVTAHAADGSKLSYQWYNADGEVEVVGANAATLNTTDPGTYYVVITATKTGFQSASIQSENATLKYRKADDATLIALTYGAENTAIALVDGVTDYRVTLPEDATVVPALTATPTMKAYGATADVTDADAFVANEAVSTVLVTAEDGDTKQEYTVTFVVKHDLDKAEDVTGSTTWNWDGVADGEVKIVAAEHGIVLANYIDAANFEKLEGQDNARAYRSNSYPAYQGTYLKFHTTVPGRLTINARYASGADLIINGKKLADLTGSRKDYTTIVFTGDVVITSSTGEYRIYNMTFEKLTVDYTRPVTSGRYGTICLPNGGLMGCAALYEVAYFDAGSQKIYFDEILDGVMEAGVPYIFLPNAGAEELQVLYTDDLNAPAGHKNGLYGSYTQEELTPNDGNYVLLNNQYLFVNSDNVYVGENRAYIRLNEISTKATPLAPGRRRIAMGVQNSQVATGMENLNAGEAPMKVMINGQLFILRGENMFDATGRLVK